MRKTFPLERRVHHNKGYGAFLFDRKSVWQPTIDLLHVERQVLLQFGLVLSCCSQRDAFCCSQSQKGKCWRASWIQRHTGAITQRTGKLWWFNSHANYLNQCTKRHSFSKKQHTLIPRHTDACVHTPTRVVNRNCTPTITTSSTWHSSMFPG